MAKQKLFRTQGNVVTGERFWDRENETRLFAELIEERAHILLVAQRRMGKTSLMAEMANKLSDKYTCIFVDVQSAETGSDVVAALSLKCNSHRNIWQKIQETFSNTLQNIEEVQVGDLGAKIRGGLSEGNWTSKGDQVFNILSEADRPVVLFMDEVPILVNRMLKGSDYALTSENIKKAEMFMSWIRKNSIVHQGKVSIVISGSIGLGPVLRQAGLSATINNFTPFELPPWDTETAKGCLDALANQYDVEFEKGATDKVVKKLGCCIPHHVQMFFGHIYEMCARKKENLCTIKDVDAVYKKHMLGVRGHAELSHYEERLKMVIGQEKLAFAMDMITEAAVEGTLSNEALKAFTNEYSFEDISIEEVQKEILWILMHDGYLKETKKGYVFVSKLLKDWWKNSNKTYYTPVMERKL